MFLKGAHLDMFLKGAHLDMLLKGGHLDMLLKGAHGRWKWNKLLLVRSYKLSRVSDQNGISLQ